MAGIYVTIQWLKEMQIARKKENLRDLSNTNKSM